MKKVQTNSRNFLFAAAFILAIGTVSPGIAHAGKNKDKTETPVAVKYIGSVNEEPVLQIRFSNESEEPVTVTLRNEEGTYLYSETFSGKEFSKNFRFEKVDLSSEDIKIELQISSKKKNESQTFLVNKTTHTVDDVVINPVQ